MHATPRATHKRTTMLLNTVHLNIITHPQLIIHRLEHTMEDHMALMVSVLLPYVDFTHPLNLNKNMILSLVKLNFCLTNNDAVHE